MTTLLVCIALAGFALLYALWVPENEVVTPTPPTMLDHLLEKKKVIYDNLKDLNFEYRTGDFRHHEPNYFSGHFDGTDSIYHQRWRVDFR